jgi:hypothetical protein
VRTDGNGYFGVANVKPGKYKVTIEGRPGTTEIRVEPGTVTRVG